MNQFENIKNIEFDINESCNIKCQYCYLQSGEKKSCSNHKLTISIFDVFFKKYKQSIKNIDSINISFWGGEPLLNFNIIKYIVEKFYRYKTKDRYITFLIVTNGTLINRKILEFCKKYNVRIQISVDGTRKTHNFLRKDKKGRGTYEKILTKIELCKSMGVDCHILTTLSAISSTPSEIVKEFRNKGVKNPFFNILNPITPYDYEHLYPVKSEEVIEDLFENFQQEFQKDVKTAIFNYPNISFIFKRFLTSSPRTSCGLDINRKAIKYDGTIYPCRRMVDSPDRCIGNVWDGINDDFEGLYHSIIRENVNCRICEYRLFCGGTCVHEIFVRSDINYVQTDLCLFMKLLCYRAIKIIVELYLKDRNKFQIICYLLNSNININKINNMNTLINPRDKMCKSPNAQCIDLYEEGVLYLENDFGKKYIVNITTMSIWDLIDGDHTALEIAKDVAKACEEKLEVMEEDIYRQLAKLKELGFVEVINATAYGKI